MNDAIECAGRLLSFGARRGPEIIRFNAALQRQALSAWSPSGPVPLRPRPANSNDPSPPLSIA